MNLHTKLQARAAAGNPIRVGLIGAGKFGSMFLSQVQRTPGMHLLGIADLSPARAHQSLERVGWPAERHAATSFGEALKKGTTFVQDSAEALISQPELDVVIDATGVPAAGIRHALLACAHRKHIVMVNVEADVLAGPILARRAAEAGIVYSMAYGDQPALIVELIDWARATGFEVVCAGKGTKYLPAYNQSTPDTVWGHYGFTKEQVAGGDFNAQMFNSFLDGTKSALEMAAIANASGLTPAKSGLAFPACGVDDLQSLLRPQSDGGILSHKGTVEVVSSLERDGRPVFRDLRWGVYVVIEAPSDYVQSCFAQYGLRTDSTGRYTAMYRALSPHRPGAGHLGGQRGPARRAHRGDDRVPRRRGGGVQARAAARRAARRRGRLHGVWPAHAGSRFAGARRRADRPGPRHHAAQRRPRRPAGEVGRRGV